LSFAAYLATFSDRSAAWAIPSAGGICLLVVGATGERSKLACAIADIAEAGRLAVQDPSSSDTHGTVGLVPDDVAAVDVSVPGSERGMTAILSNNAWISIGTRAKSIVVRLTTGAHRGVSLLTG
jgi:hypothetical protein